MKDFIKNILLKAGIWYKVQFSDWYREMKKPGYRKKIASLSTFYRQLFGNRKVSLIFDIGANVGDYSYVYSRLAEKLVIIEPDQKNVRILTSRFGSKKGISIVPAAVSDKEGTADFFMEDEGSTLNTLSDKWVDVLSHAEKSRFTDVHRFGKRTRVQTITLDQLIRQYGKPDYIKIDVEGFEKQVISGLKTIVPWISFECNLPEFADETVWIIDHLVSINPDVEFNIVDEDRFRFEKPVSAPQIRDMIRGGKYRFLEIYCHQSAAKN